MNRPVDDQPLPPPRPPGRKISPLRYLLGFMNSLLFHIELLYPLRFMTDSILVDQSQPMLQLMILLRRVALNLPLLVPGEREELYKLVAEDCRRHFVQDFEIDEADNRELRILCERFLEAAMAGLDDEKLLTVITSMLRGL